MAVPSTQEQLDAAITSRHQLLQLKVESYSMADRAAHYRKIEEYSEVIAELRATLAAEQSNGSRNLATFGSRRR